MKIPTYRPSLRQIPGYQLTIGLTQRQILRGVERIPHSIRHILGMNEVHGQHFLHTHRWHWHLSWCSHIMKKTSYENIARITLPSKKGQKHIMSISSFYQRPQLNIEPQALGLYLEASLQEPPLSIKSMITEALSLTPSSTPHMRSSSWLYVIWYFGVHYCKIYKVR